MVLQAVLCRLMRPAGGVSPGTQGAETLVSCR